jgi:acyl-coenzyme A thioesterase PaaI-like protein
MPRRRPTPKRLQRLINWYPPFLFSGIRLVEISDDWSFARVRLRSGRLTRNYVGTHFGGSLFAMCDPFWMIMIMERLGPAYIVWDKAAEIDFLKAVSEPVFAEFRLDAARVESLRAQADRDGKALQWFEVTVATAAGEPVARVRKQIYVRGKAPG